jgi:hypothetical protein
MRKEKEFVQLSHLYARNPNSLMGSAAEKMVNLNFIITFAWRVLM